MVLVHCGQKGGVIMATPNAPKGQGKPKGQSKPKGGKSK